jgi:hypothetical protein
MGWGEIDAVLEKQVNSGENEAQVAFGLVKELARLSRLVSGNFNDFDLSSGS